MPSVNWSGSKWQVQLEGKWQQYDDAEDKVLKQAYENGQKMVRYDTRGKTYEVSFRSMTQLNLKTKKVRRVRNRALTKKAPPKVHHMGGGGAAKPAAAKPAPKKGCCPCLKPCCGFLVAVPVISILAIMISGNTEELGDMAADIGDMTVDAAEDFGEVMVEWGEAIAGGAEDAIEHIAG